jgi:ribosomal protein S18 acetylase RimI-like enzyme
VLARTVHDTLTGQGMTAVVGEFVGDHGLTVADTYGSLGYTRFERMLMSAELADERLQGAQMKSMTYVCNEWAADVLVDAYRGHPSRPIHPETHDREAAMAFLETYQSGAFGVTHEHYYRAKGTGETYDGVIAGAEAAPDVGFVLHVATKRAAQGAGIGQQLILDLAEAFRRDGYSRIALGVTRGNRAEKLYTRLGFEWLAPVETYVWWADPGQSC